MQVYFDVQQLYYVPQYTPVQAALEQKGVACTYVFYEDTALAAQQKKVADSLGCDVKWVSDVQQAKSIYIKDKPEWVVIGNYFEDLEQIHQHSRTALLSHGIGPKACYYTVSDSNPSVRFVEGPYRTQRLKELYPQSVFVDTGYAKLDPLVAGESNALSLSDLGLKQDRKTLLYAPTFYPSSIERLSWDFPTDFEEHNIILKPHYFSLANPSYKQQKKRLIHWSSYDNVYLAGIDDVNIVPFMGLADVLISDASSTLFEFAALDKPVVWCDFFKLRMGYRGIFKFRFQNRMDEDLYKYADIAVHAKNYKDLKEKVDTQILYPNEKQKERKRYAEALAGTVDGRVSQRIAEYMLNKGVS